MIPVTVLEFGDRGLSIVDPPAARGGQSSELKTVWITLAAVLAVVLLIVAGIVLVVAHRRRASRYATNRTESDGKQVPANIESSLAEMGAFLSEENALEGPEHSPRKGPE
jgi:heme/copper-type cytochrome/quinol oxidase subunit 2